MMHVQGESAPGSNKASQLFLSPILTMRIYVGINPPEKSIAKMRIFMSTFLPTNLGLLSGYAANTLTDVCRIVPVTVRKIEQPSDLRMVVSYLKSCT